MQSRKWQLTINNPSEKGITHDVLRESLAKFTGMLYWCMCDETGGGGTYHTHVYFVLRTPTVHTVVENRFPNIHRENVKGTSQQNRDYVLKEGEKYNKLPDGSYNYTDGSGKTHTGVNHTATFEEWGDMPQEHQGKSKDVEKIYALIKDGATNLEIIDAVPSGMMNIDKIERTRSILRDAHFADDWRDLHVTYIFGTTGSGKTRSVMDKYGYRNCYRVTDYKHPFDSYNGQDVLIFVYYCHPYRSTERASNERANHIIRRFFPKGVSFAKYTSKDCQRVQDWMNNYPRKILDYSTPAELFQKELENLC